LVSKSDLLSYEFLQSHSPYANYYCSIRQREDVVDQVLHQCAALLTIALLTIIGVKRRSRLGSPLHSGNVCLRSGWRTPDFPM
jgi:hypothetical protein